MVWRGLLRVVDFEALLSAQAGVTEALEAAVRRDGASSEAARSLRQGFNLLAKVVFTARAAVPDVHDLAWLDHAVLSKGSGASHLWTGERNREAWDRLSSNRGHMGEIAPRPRHGSWADVPVGNLPRGDSLKVERGIAGSFSAGLVTQDGLLELMDELGGFHSRAPEVMAVAGELRRLAEEARREGRESVALVYVASA